MKLSYKMTTVLRKVKAGLPPYLGGGPYRCSNTNSTANALRERGLIELAVDQTRAITFENCYVITDAGVEALGE